MVYLVSAWAAAHEWMSKCLGGMKQLFVGITVSAKIFNKNHLLQDSCSNLNKFSPVYSAILLVELQYLSQNSLDQHLNMEGFEIKDNCVVLKPATEAWDVRIRVEKYYPGDQKGWLQLTAKVLMYLSFNTDRTCNWKSFPEWLLFFYLSITRLFPQGMCLYYFGTKKALHLYQL